MPATLPLTLSASLFPCFSFSLLWTRIQSNFCKNKEGFSSLQLIILLFVRFLEGMRFSYQMQQTRSADLLTLQHLLPDSLSLNTNWLEKRGQAPFCRQEDVAPMDGYRLSSLSLLMAIIFHWTVRMFVCFPVLSNWLSWKPLSGLVRLLLNTEACWDMRR